MEIHVLRASISEQDIKGLVDRHLDEDLPIEDMRIEVAADGVRIKGVYPLFINVSFETHWELGVLEGKLTARLAGFKAMGVPGTIFKSAILKMLADAAEDKRWLQISSDMLVLDLEMLAMEQGLTARTNLASVSCQTGLIVIESGGLA